MVGDRCDRCPANSTGTFPNCEECDECADQWEERIVSLAAQISETVLVVSDLNLTNQMQDIDIPDLDQLLQLAREIEATLNGSNVATLSSDIQSTHELVCELTNMTRELLQRALTLQGELETSENSSLTILSGLDAIARTLSDLERELANVSMEFNAIAVPSSPSPSQRLLVASREALRVAEEAESLVATNFTSVLSNIRSTLVNFDLLNSSTVEDVNDMLLARVADVQQRIDSVREFLDDASSQLCVGGGSPNNNDSSSDDNACEGECGGVGCDTCGAADSCDGLRPRAIQALNTSEVALTIARSLVVDVRSRLELLQMLQERVRSLADEGRGFEEEVERIQSAADDILLELLRLISELEMELNVTRVDTREIERIVNETLELQLLSPVTEVGLGGADLFFTQCSSYSSLRRWRRSTPPLTCSFLAM